MRVSAKADYAIRAVVELAARGEERPVKAEAIATEQNIPTKYLLNILFDLKRSGIVASQRGAEGGYRLGRAPEAISLADIIRAVEGPLAQVGDFRPDELNFHGSAEALYEVWIAVRSNLHAILETVSVADVANDTLPAVVHELATNPDAWQPHTTGMTAGDAFERRRVARARNTKRSASGGK